MRVEPNSSSTILSKLIRTTTFPASEIPKSRQEGISISDEDKVVVRFG
jgi:hypothetical protein